MQLVNVQELMEEKLKNNEFDSYALYIKTSKDEHTFFSKNVNEDTYFDIASCGKVLVTTPLVLQTIDKGLLSLDSTLNDFFENVPDDKSGITVKDLLTHTSGIVRHNYGKGTHSEILDEILSRPLKYETGKACVYSCSGMVLLGFILEKIWGDSLENLFEKFLKKPLCYTRSKFNIKLNEENSAVCYRTENVDGLAHPWDDENIRMLQTSAGSGGQFFTLADIKKFASAVLEKDERLYSKKMFDISEKQYTAACLGPSRGLGWLYVDEKYSQTGRLFPKGSFGHCGHTGQSIFFSREKDMCVVILTNATRCLNKRSGFKGYDYGIVCKMREEIHNAIKNDLTSEGIL